MKELSFRIKRDSKFVTVARYGKNKYGNMRLSLNKKLFIELMKGEGDWLDFSVFENDEKQEKQDMQEINF